MFTYKNRARDGRSRGIPYPLFRVPAGPADHLRTERDVEPKGDERERCAAAAEGDAATREMRVHHSHHRRKGGDEKQERHKANKNRASASRAGGFLLDECHSGDERSAYALYLQLAGKKGVRS